MRRGGVAGFLGSGGFAATENVNYAVGVHHCHMAFSYLSC